jgi:hypothetical protein
MCRSASSERPVRSASSSSAAGCLPCPRCQEPWPNAGTTAPVGNFTVRLAPLDAGPLASSTADASDDATKEPTATQSPLNSRRFSNRILTPYTIPSTAPIALGRDGGSAVAAARRARSKPDGAPNFGPGVYGHWRPVANQFGALSETVPESSSAGRSVATIHDKKPRPSQQFWLRQWSSDSR